MAKIKNAILILLILMFLPVYGYAFQNEPNGFRDLYWGESLEEVQQDRKTQYFSYMENINSVLFAVALNNDEPHELSNVPIWGRGFVASFWENKLYSIALFFTDEDAFERLKSSMTILYGMPKTMDDACLWVGADTIIFLNKMNKEPAGCAVRLSSVKILAEISEENARQGWLSFA